MKRNVGKVDKTLRLVVGILGIGAAIYFQSWWGLLALIPLVTASINWCPLYSVFGISSCKMAEQS